MPVRSSDIHPALQKRYTDKVMSEFRKGDSGVSRFIYPLLRFLFGIIALFVLLHGLRRGFSGNLLLILLPLLYFVCRAAVALAFQQTWRTSIERIEMMRATLPAVCSGKGEKAYVRAFLAVGSVSGFRREQSRALSVALSALLDDYHTLSRQQETLTQSLADHDSQKIAAQIADAEEHLAATSDPLVQQATTRSLEFLRTQREDIRSLETSRERIESQKDALVNAFDSFALTLSRGQAAGAIVAPADANHLAYLAHQLHGETRAVEATVHQALTVGPGPR